MIIEWPLKKGDSAVSLFGGCHSTAFTLGLRETQVLGTLPALQRNVVDCALTGTLSGNTAGWPEVSTHLYPLPVGWSLYYTAANLDTWQEFEPEVRAFFEKRRLRAPTPAELATIVPGILLPSFR